MTPLFFKKSWMLFFSVCCVVAQGFAQNANFIGTQTEVYAKQPTLTKMFADFYVFSLNSRALKAKCSANEQVSFNLVLGNVRTLPIHLLQNDIRSADYRLMSGTDKGAVELPKGANTTYMGYTDDGAKVRMTINDDFIMGYYKYGRESFFIEPLNGLIAGVPNDLYIVYRSKDVIPNPNLKCGLTETEDKTIELNRGGANHATSRALPTGCMNVRLAIATDYDAYANKFGGSTTNVTNHTIGVTNNVITDYDSDFDKMINFNIVTNYVSTTAVNAFETALTAGLDGDILLQNFSKWASGTNFTDGGFGMMHDLGSVWVKRDISGSVIGKAWLGGICTPITTQTTWAGQPNASYRYNILEADFSGANAATVRVVTSHEYGHNFNCSHDAGGSIYIMAPIVSTSTTWSAATMASLNAHIASSSCLMGSLTAVQGSPVARFNLNTTECLNYTIPLTDASGPFPTAWNWTVTGGAPASATAQNTSVTFSTLGSKNVTLDASNSACGSLQSNSITKTVNIINQQHPTATCAINATNTGNTQNVNIGIYNVTFGTINYSSGYTLTEGGVYYDRTCGQLTTLSALTTPISVTVGNLNDERVRVYIDINNDGTFQGNELLLQMVGKNTLTGSLSIPCSGVTTNTLLRMRVVSDLNGTAAAACTTPQYGQVEDYGVIIPPSIFTSNPTAACAVNATNQGTASSFGMGIYNVTLGSINYTSPDTYNEGAVYFDRACSQTTTLSAVNSSVSVTVGTLNIERVRIYIDLNNDGTYQSTEQLLTMVGTGTLTGTLAIPCGGVTTNTLLRMRVVSDFNGTTAAACTTPQYGQIEDYGVTIPSSIFINTPPTATCAINATNTGTAGNYNIGIYNVTLGSINYSSGYTFTEGGVYYDRTCQQYVTLSSRTNSISVTVGNLNDERVRIYVDLNNNGTFEASEFFLQMTGRNTLTGTFTLPGFGVVNNTLLRMRVVSDNLSNGATACTTPVYGQIEDYGLIFPTSLSSELTNFEGHPLSKNIELTWQTASEKDNERFDIERSTDGKLFSKIGQTKGHGTTNQVQNYDYVDTNPFSGVNYYRLKQVDTDGQFTYSKTVSVEMSNAGKNISVYPNPVKDKVTIETTIQGDYSVELFDITGKLLQAHKANQPTMQLTINDLPNGVYMISVKSNAVQQTFKIVKQ
jgi:hypothetical protein